MDTLPNEIVHHILEYCHEGLRYISLMNDVSYMPYLDNDEEAMLFAVKFYMKDIRVLYKYPKSLALAHNKFMRNKDMNEFVRHIYSDINDVAEYAIHSGNRITLTEDELSKIPLDKFMKLNLRGQYYLIDWLKYIMHDADAVTKMIRKCWKSELEKQKFELISDKVWDQIETDPKFSWRKYTRQNYMNIDVITWMSHDTIMQLKPYPKYLKKYFKTWPCITRDNEKIMKTFDLVIDNYECAAIFLQRIKFLSDINDKKHHDFVESLIEIYYDRYKSNIPALEALYNRISCESYCGEFIKKIRKTLVDNMSMANYVLDKYDIGETSVFHLYMLTLKCIDFNKKNTIYLYLHKINTRPEYMEVIIGNFNNYFDKTRVENNIYEDHMIKYDYVIDKYTKHRDNIRLSTDAPFN